MEKIADYFKHFSDRFRNPFVLSFFVSWTVINWRVIIAVLLYKKDDLIEEKVTTMNQYISKVVTFESGVQHPLASALAFTIFYPILTAALYVLYGKIQSIGRDLHLKWIRHSTIPTTQFIELQEKSDSYIDRLQKMIIEKSSFEAEKKEHSLKLAEKDAEIKRLTDDQNLRDVSVMRGKWTVHISASGSVSQQLWIIDGNTVTRTTGGEKKSPLMNLYIQNFAKAGDKILLYFNKGAVYDPDVEFHVLVQPQNTKRLSGKDQYGRDVQYTFNSELQE